VPDAGFEQFFRDTATLAWPSADAIARRGRQRRRRQRIVAALGAATVLIGAVAAGATVRGGGADPVPEPPASPQATTSASPTGGTSAPVSPSGTGPSSPAASSPVAPLTQVPLTAMLTAADAGPGDWTVSENADGDWTVYFTLSLCTAPLGPGGTDLHTRERSLRRGEAEIAQRVRAFSPADAAVEVAALRAKVVACATFKSRSTGDEISLRIVRDGFALDADESFLVESRAGGEVGWYVIVRKGALMAEIVVWPNTQDESVRFGRAAAVRLTRAAG
jgi:hypothetical protein